MADERPAPVGVRFAEPDTEGPFPEKNETDAFIEDERSSFDSGPKHRHDTVSRLNKSALIPWILTGLFALTSFLLLLERYGIRKFGTYEDRLETDLSALLFRNVPRFGREIEIADIGLETESLSHVPLERRRFVGSPKFDENGTMYTDPTDPKAEWPENLVLAGEPSDKIDNNWDDVLEDLYFSVSDSEAEVAWGDRRREYVDEAYGGYTAALDVFYQLQCLVREMSNS